MNCLIQFYTEIYDGQISTYKRRYTRIMMPHSPTAPSFAERHGLGQVWFLAIFAVAASSVILGLLLPQLPIGLADECYPYAVAQALAQGQQLYEDIELYSYVPGIFLVHRLAFKLGGESVHSGRMVGVFFGAFALGACVLVAGQLLPRWATFFLAAVLLMTLSPWHKAYVQLAHCVWFAAALLACQSGQRRHVALAAALAFLTFGLRFDAAVIAASGIIWLVVVGSWEEPGNSRWQRRFFGRTVAAAAGAAIGGGFLVAIMWANNCLGGFFGQLIDLPMRMLFRNVEVHRLPPPSLSSLMSLKAPSLFSWTWTLALVSTSVCLALLLVSMVRMLHSRTPHRSTTFLLTRNGLLMLWIAGNTLQFAWERPDAAHILQQAVCPVLAICLVTTQSTGNRWKLGSALLLAATTVICLINLDLSLTSLSPYLRLSQQSVTRELSNGMQYPTTANNSSHHLFENILELTTVEDSVLAAPYLPGVYFLCKRNPPGRELYIFPFNLPNESAKQQFLNRLQAHPPAAIVLNRRFSLSGDSQYSFSVWAPEIDTWISDHYQKINTAGPNVLLTPIKTY